MMYTCFVILVSLCIIVRFFLFRQKKDRKLPPGPSFLSSHIILLTNSLLGIEPVLRKLKSKYGPLITLSLGSHPIIFVADHALAHQILIKNGAVVSDRPRIFRFRTITSASYGPNWRALRRNLSSVFLHTSRVNSFSWARKWVLGNLVGHLQKHNKEAEGIMVLEHFRYAIFSLSLIMCFGEKLDECQIQEILAVQRHLLSLAVTRKINVYMVFPWLFKILFRNTWKLYEKLRTDQKQKFMSLIKSERKSLGKEQVAYIDTLMSLKLPVEEADNKSDENLTDKALVSMCGEFLNTATDTTTTTLQWIMANLVMHPHIQSKLYDEIVAVVGPSPQLVPSNLEFESVIDKDDLQKMPYLKAVVLEGLRRHPPGHLVLPHRVMKDVEVQGYVIPEGATLNFMVGEMGLDPKVWEDPMEFNPERFLSDDSSNNDVFDITGNKGIKMMPFGVGRRICPATDLALLHLEYFVANLIWYFQWTTPYGYHVDLSERVDFTVTMKNPLQAQILMRARQKVNC
ncbi:cytochrome P450 89A2-like protein [Tanacetum coccineum]|uniref:Cytochrome P450 89A2-like protein n=1 Tax=Tanacetum coccineum TaxID=301880 RepID=A0ABQ5GQP2_9ASTR